MNYLTQIMEVRGYTPKDVAEMSGCAVTNIRRIMKLDSLEFAYPKTVSRLSAALGVTPRELVKGGKRMKDKVLKAKITKSVEEIAVALRNYTDEPLYLNITVFSRDNTVRLFGDPEGTPDFYSIRCHSTENLEADNIDLIIGKSARVYYSQDKDTEELIRTVIPFGESDYDSQR